MNKEEILITLDFCKMVCKYMETDVKLNPLYGYAINYGEIQEWSDKYTSICKECMSGENAIAQVADDLTEAMYNFAQIIKKHHVHK
jgi:hypothetical protein